MTRSAVARRLAALGLLLAGAAALLPGVAGSAGLRSFAGLTGARTASMAVPKLTVGHLGEDYAALQLSVSDTAAFSTWVEVNGGQHCLTQLQPGSYQIACTVDLTPGSVSEIRVAASDPQLGTHYGSDILANPAATDAPYFFGTSVGPYLTNTEALSTNVDPEGSTTTWHVEYGPTPSLGTATPNQAVPGSPGGSGGVPSQAFMYGLTAGATYYYDVVGTNGSGATTTPVGMFTVGGGSTTTGTTTTTTTATTTTAATTTSSTPATTTTATTTTTTGTTTTAPASTANVSHSIRLAKRTKTAGCTRGPNPDRRCSPGAYDGRLATAAICSPAFRGAPGVTDSTRRAVQAEYGLSARSYGRSIEIDRIVGVELGGSNDIANLFPEAGTGKANYHVKDRLEKKLHTLVCSAKMPLRAAQTGIASNWQALYKRVFGVAPGKLTR